MSYVMFRTKVEDYASWRQMYDEHGATRLEGGSKGGQVFRNADDPNEVVILLQWDSHENARKFTESDDLKEAMQRAGVTAPPDIVFLDEME